MNDSGRRPPGEHDSLQPAAGNGLLDRRALLGRGVLFAGAAATGVGTSLTGAAAEPLKDDPWSSTAGSVSPAYEQRSKFEQQRVNRILSNPNNEPRTSHARTPHHLLEGTITPNGLHFTIVQSFTRFRAPWNWNGGPAILQSRAWDEAGNVQPLRADFVAVRGQTARPVTNPLAFTNQHYNSITSWAVDPSGQVKHVYA